MFGKIIAGPVMFACIGAAQAFACLPVPYGLPTQCNDEILAVDAANLEIHDGNFTITAQGTASTAGWKNVRLRLESFSPDGDTLTYRLVGCAPEIAAEVLTPVSAREPLVMMLPTNVRRVTILARINSQTLNLDEFRKPLHAN